jgi:hypothetical protein
VLDRKNRDTCQMQTCWCQPPGTRSNSLRTTSSSGTLQQCTVNAGAVAPVCRSRRPDGKLQHRSSQQFLTGANGRASKRLIGGALRWDERRIHLQSKLIKLLRNLEYQRRARQSPNRLTTAALYTVTIAGAHCPFMPAVEAVVDLVVGRRPARKAVEMEDLAFALGRPMLKSPRQTQAVPHLVAVRLYSSRPGFDMPVSCTLGMVEAGFCNA